MSGEAPKTTPKKQLPANDDDRKFVADPIGPEFLKAQGATWHDLVIGWLETGEDSETKVVHKTSENGAIQILRIAKVRVNGSRIPVKEAISEETYKQLAASSSLRLEKKRYEFTYVQNDIPFALKYDEYADSELRVLEVNAATEADRSAFDPDLFPVGLKEVTDDIGYYGYRVIDKLSTTG